MDAVHQLGRDGTVGGECRLPHVLLAEDNNNVVQSEVSVGCPTYYYQRIIIMIRKGKSRIPQGTAGGSESGTLYHALTARATWRIKEDSLAKSTR
jgi:hypothetical protein